MNAYDLDTPALYVDLGVLERNIARMQAQCRTAQLKLRPRTNAHRIAEIARWQLSTGAIGLAAATLSEASALPGDDWLISYPVFGDKAGELQEFARNKAVAIVVDSVGAARAAGETPAWVQLQLGADDWGAPTPEAAVQVAQACARFAGVSYCHAAQGDIGLPAADGKLAAVLDQLGHVGLAPQIISARATVGPTGGAFLSGTNEMRPGEYVFNDATLLREGACTESDCALRVLVAVVSTAVPRQCIIDAGSKTFSNNATPGTDTFGHFLDRPWTLRKMNEEHGFVAIEGSARVGEKVWVIPSRASATVNMHNEVWFGRDSRVEGRWPVSARGKVR